jgi:hypothetical protein
MTAQEDIRQLNILAESMGFKVDGVVRTDGGTAIILVDADGQEIAYQGINAEDAVHIAAHRLSLAIEGSDHGAKEACEDCGY